MKIDLDDIERKAKAATPGPWIPGGSAECGYGWVTAQNPSGQEIPVLSGQYWRQLADAQHIAAANPAVVLELVRRLREAEVAKADLIHALDECRGRFEEYVQHHLDKGDLHKAASNEYWVKLAGDAIDKAQGATPCQGHARQQDGEESRCTWSLPTAHDEDNGIWHSSCGELWSFIDGGPVENRVRYCHGCGKPVDVQPYVSTQEAKNGD